MVAVAIHPGALGQNPHISTSVVREAALDDVNHGGELVKLVGRINASASVAGRRREGGDMDGRRREHGVGVSRGEEEKLGLRVAVGCFCPSSVAMSMTRIRIPELVREAFLTRAA
ncbi:hypothetical protein OsJ_12650 [Oryza sativa Japonica Group]|uniref:Uncharacterized protein n=1 Tax=Oryza sativa subsp. japonica TaxID=39947 RepID=B9F5S7_ORYSJ|nr:hypothetical protein OsJ_12650 [Oryza sativa Japonica Group]